MAGTYYGRRVLRPLSSGISGSTATARRRPTGGRARSALAAVAAVALAGGTLTACSGGDGPDRTVDAFLSGWRDGRLDPLGFVDTGGRKIPAKDVAEQLKQLSGDLAASKPELRRDGAAKEANGIATATVTVDWPLPGGQRWSYPTTVRLKKGADDAWQVIWDPSVVQEKLTSGEQLAVTRRNAPRAAVLDGAGQPLVTARPVVLVGVQPDQVTDPVGLTKQLDAAFRAVRPAFTPPIDVSDLSERIRTGKPGSFVEVLTLRREAYLQIKSKIYDLPGTRFQEQQRDLAPTRQFARALLGSVDPVQKQDIDADPARYGLGDLVGHGGLAGRYDQQLRGTAGASVIITRRNPDGVVEPTGEEVFRVEPKPGSPFGPRWTSGPRTPPTPPWPATPHIGPPWWRCGSATAPCWPQRTARPAPPRTWPSPPRSRRARPSRWSAPSACWTAARSPRTPRSPARRRSPYRAGRR
ncbi:hypothetical protein GCM10027605_60220 [Micromonospora zhanjiangensis]